MYIRSMIAVCIVSLSLVGSIPIMERGAYSEVYARGAKLRVPSIKHDSKGPPHAPHGEPAMGHGHVVHNHASHRSHKPSHSESIPHKSKAQPGKHASPKPSPPKHGKTSPVHKSNKPISRGPQQRPPEKKAPQSKVRKGIVLFTGHSPEVDARAANMARQMCKVVSDCHCPARTDRQATQSTACINGVCSCNNPTINFFAGQFIDAVKAIGNSPITQAVSHLMQGLADVKEVVSTIVGAFLGPEAKAALKVALLAFPDTGPSHIDQATKGILTKIL